ncbi:MAG: ATP-binding protein [Kiritimatiellae bacterium]|nr:ATP-binding protein [Kiritimatiellia bacterium]
MKEKLEQFVDDALARTLPKPMRREITVKSHHDMVSVLVGMRRTGKTWLCFQQIHDLMAQGIPNERILYLNFEDERLTGLTADRLHWITEIFYARQPANRERDCHFFFDEIQNVPGWEQYVRRLLDNEHAHITVTGSSAKLLSREIASSLRGRALTTEVFPLDFHEYNAFHGLAIPANGGFGATVRSLMMKAVVSYLHDGGFPAVQDMEPEMRQEVLQGYVDAVLLRDIIERHGVSNIPALRALTRHLLHNPATNFSVTRFFGQIQAEGISCTRDTLHMLLSYLEDAYLVFPVELLSRSVQRRRVNPRKVYLADTGLLSAFSLGLTPDRGARLENLVYLSLRRRGLQVAYGLTNGGHEVDFVYSQKGRQHALQVCWALDDHQTRSREIQALNEISANIQQASQTIVTWMDEGEESGVRIVPAWKWLLE